MKLNVGDTGSLSTLSRPVSAVGAKSQEPKIEEFSQLSLGQKSDQARSSAAGTPVLIPLKRTANRSGSQEAKVQGDGRGLPRNRRVKGLSGESISDVAGQSLPVKPAPGKRPLNPNSDNAAFGRSRPAEVGSQAQPRDTNLSPQRTAKKQSSMELQPKVELQAGQPGLVDTSTLPSSPAIENENFSRIEINFNEPEPIDEWDADPELLLQPETRPISHEQLVHEVKGIYAGLVMVEAKCIDVDGKQSAAAQERDPSRRTQLTPEQWSALIALHKTLLHEHHDFFLASQHPSASPALTKLAEKYSMPARMWKHGIHAFLEVLRLHLPSSLDHMLAFIYIAYSMMALLFETVPSFEDTWIECLGDLGRYRMAIGDEDVKDRDVWSGVARFWYGKAADKTPEVSGACKLVRDTLLMKRIDWTLASSSSHPCASIYRSAIELVHQIADSSRALRGRQDQHSHSFWSCVQRAASEPVQARFSGE